MTSAAGMDYARFFAEVKANGIGVPAIIEHVNENSAPEMRRERQRMERFLPQ